MSREYERLSPSAGKSNLTRNVLILMVVAFIGGAILTGWILSRYNPFDSAPGTETAAIADREGAKTKPDPATALANRIDADGTVLPPATQSEATAPTTTLTPDLERALAVRVADLEDRLSRINVQAQAASGNAARAEGLLIAFAARRALDRGSPLGYIDPQLRLRFGDAQPKAERRGVLGGFHAGAVGALRHPPSGHAIAGSAPASDPRETLCRDRQCRCGDRRSREASRRGGRRGRFAMDGKGATL